MTGGLHDIGIWPSLWRSSLFGMAVGVMLPGGERVVDASAECREGFRQTWWCGMRCVMCKSRTKKPPDPVRERGVIDSGDVLLSHDLSSYYHRRNSVSLPCSEWERVVPLCHDHQTAEHGIVIV